MLDHRRPSGTLRINWLFCGGRRGMRLCFSLSRWLLSRCFCLSFRLLLGGWLCLAILFWLRLRLWGGLGLWTLLRLSGCRGSLLTLLLLLPRFDDGIQFVNVCLESSKLFLGCLARGYHTHQCLQLGICCSSRSQHLNHRVRAWLRRLAIGSLLPLLWPLSTLRGRGIALIRAAGLLGRRMTSRVTRTACRGG